MRLAWLKITKRFSLPLLALVILLTLAISVPSDQENSSAKTLSEDSNQNQQVFSDEAVNGSGVNVEANLDGTNNVSNTATEDGSTNVTSSSTKVKISVNTNSTSGDTSGSASISVSNNGNTTDLSNTLDKCLKEGDFEVNEDGKDVDCKLDTEGLNLDFSFKSKEKSKTDISKSSNIEEEQSSD